MALVVLVLDGKQELGTHLNAPTLGEDVEQGAPFVGDAIRTLPLVDPLSKHHRVQVDPEICKVCRNPCPAAQGDNQVGVRKRLRFHKRIIRRILGIVNAENDSDDKRLFSAENSDMAKKITAWEMGHRLKRVRKVFDVRSQAGLARKLSIAAKRPIDQKSVDAFAERISIYERGESNIPYEVARAVEAAFKVPVSYLLDGEFRDFGDNKLREDFEEAHADWPTPPFPTKKKKARP